MDKNCFIAIIFLFVYISTTCNSSLVSHRRELIASDGNSSSATSQVHPIPNLVNNTSTNASSIDTEKSQLDKGNQTNSDGTLPIDPKGSNKANNKTEILGAPSPPAGDKNGSIVDGDKGKAKEVMPKLDDNGSCEGSVSICKEQGMITCIMTSRDGGSDEIFLVTINEGEKTLKVNVGLPNSLETILPDFEVPKHKSRRTNISSSLIKSNKLIVTTENNPPCELALVQSVQSVSVDKIIQQLSFYSKQVTPIYAVYASFLVTLLLGATWACCRLRKRNQQDGIQYQELEMGIPESASAAVDVSEGWDRDWDDDWDEEIAVKSPSGHQVISVSADGLTSRPSKRDGWDNDWED